MVDDFLKDESKMSDIGAMRAMLEQLVEMVKRSQESIDKLTRTIEDQTKIIELKDDRISQLEQMLFGNKSEKMVTVSRQVKKRRNKDASKAAKDKERTRQKRKNNAAAKKKLEQENKEHTVADEDCKCPFCGGDKYTFIGWEESVEYEFVPAHFKKVVHRREKKACTCGQHVLTGPAPVRVSDGVIYGPGMHAHAVVSKCLDSIPFYRMSKQFERTGIPLARSTICDMFHRSAELLAPIYDRIIELVPAEKYVNADETRIKVQEKEKCREAWMWTFIAGPFVAYAFSPSRSGETPVKILGDSQGVLQVDQYSGYNQVTTPDKRQRAGCMGHARRKFYEARDKAPDLVDHVLDQILELYIVEYDAADEEILGTDKHLAMRQVRSKPILEDLKERLEEEEPSHLPKGPIAKAIGYFLGNYDALELFLTDPNIALDNNISERQLRLIALGRKNYLFVGNDVAGQNLAILQTFVATCVANDVNPQEYLTDVLIRIQTHPKSKIDELLPHLWKRPPPPGERDQDTEAQDE
jgi:transposase